MPAIEKGLANWIGRLDEAIAIRKWTVASDPLNANLHFRVGAQLNFLEQPDEAIGSLRTALKLSPSHWGARSFIGYALL